MNMQEEKRLKETIYFLSLCGETDRRFLDIPQEKRETEDYARLMSITMIFGFKTITAQLVARAEKRMPEINELLGIVSKDYKTIKKWVDEFVENIINLELKAIVREAWEEKLERVNKTNFEIKCLIK